MHFLVLFIMTIVPNKIVVDGVLHRDQMAAYYKDTSSITVGLGNPSKHLGIDSVFVARDNHNVYIRIKSKDTLYLGNYGDLFVAIDTGSASGGLYSPFSKHVKFTGNLPDYVLYVNDNNDCSLLRYDDTLNAWQNTGTSVLCGGAGNHPDFEISFPRDSIGNPQNINLALYTTYYKNGDSIVDYQVGDTSYAHITLDAQRDTDYSLVGISDQSGGNGADLDSLFVAWDSLNLYVFINTLNSASWNAAYGIGFDVDQVAGSGYYTGDADAWGRKIDFADTLSTEPYAIDYEMYFFWDDSSNSITSANFCKWNGTGFDYDDITDSTSWYVYSGGANGLGTLEIKIPLSKLGILDSTGKVINNKILLSTWIAGGSGSSAVDIIPHDDQISNSQSEWTDVDTIYSYVSVNLDKPSIQDVNVSYFSGGGKAPDSLSLSNQISLNSSLLTFGYYDYSNWGNAPVGFLYPIDGVVDTGGFDEDEMLLCSDNKNAWLTWDGDSIYLGYTYQAFDSGYGGDGDLFIYFQIDSVSSSNPLSDTGCNVAVDWWNGDSIILGFNADYAIAIEDGNYYALYGYNDATNTWDTLYNNNDFPGSAYIGHDNDSATANGTTELSIARSALGNPMYLGVLFFAHTDATGEIYGISPIDTTLKFKEISNADGINDTLKHFWGIYRLNDTNVVVNSIRDQYPPLGIEEQRSAKSTTFFSIKHGILYVNTNNRPDVVEIYNITGQRILKRYVSSKKNRIPLKGVRRGIYFIKLLHNKERGKFIIF